MLMEAAALIQGHSHSQAAAAIKNVKILNATQYVTATRKVKESN